MVKNKFLLFIFAFFMDFTISSSVEIANYGTYCGLGHTNYTGAEPIDKLDRICQKHDICVSALSLTNCFCNQQLYAYVSLYNPTNDASTIERNKILSAIYESIGIPCTGNNPIYLGNSVFLYYKDGFQYIPYYPSSSGMTVSTYSIVPYIYLRFDTQEKYHNFALSMTHSTGEFIQYPHQWIDKNTSWIMDSTFTVFLNPSNDTSMQLWIDEFYSTVAPSPAEPIYINNNHIVHDIFGLVFFLLLLGFFLWGIYKLHNIRKKSQYGLLIGEEYLLTPHEHMINKS